MTHINIKQAYPTKDEIQQLKSDLPRGWAVAVARKLVANGEKRDSSYVSNVMQGRYKNVNVVAAVIQYRNELNKLLIIPNK